MGNKIDTRVIKTAIVGYGFSTQTFHLPFVDTLPEFDVSASSSQVDTVLIILI